MDLNYINFSYISEQNHCCQFEYYKMQTIHSLSQHCLGFVPHKRTHTHTHTHARTHTHTYTITKKTFTEFKYPLSLSVCACVCVCVYVCVYVCVCVCVYGFPCPDSSPFSQKKFSISFCLDFLSIEKNKKKYTNPIYNQIIHNILF